MQNKKLLFGVVYKALLASIIAAVLIFIASTDVPYNIKKFYYASDFGITEKKSNNDKDGDGVDDRTDLLLSARHYIENKKPIYKSKYYVGGYPDDKYGVCTDVVGFASLNAGYDMMQLIDNDIARYPNDYKIETPDKNIDFRRVSNLWVYYEKYAQSLTVDITDIKEWQGGDIVIFYEHIGIVSDRRNARGIPYVIHHSGSPQLWYEEDILEKRKKDNDILAHYRLK